MKAVMLIACVLAVLVCTSVATVFDENTCASALAPNAFFDSRFSNNSCIVIGDELSFPDCSRAPPSRGEPQVDDGCPGYPDDDDGDLLPTGQVLFENLADAIENCPFRNPTLIEFVGTQYMWDNSGLYDGLFFNATGDLVIRGISYQTQIGGDPVIVLTPFNVTETIYFELQFNATTNVTSCEPTAEALVPLPPSTPIFNATTNLTECVPSEYTYTAVDYIETLEYTPVTNVSIAPTVVGFKDFQVTQQNVSITMENAIYKGCGTESPVFLTEFCPRECVFPDPLDICAGAFFRQKDADHILNNGTCMRTGAYFDGDRFLMTPTNGSAWTTPFDRGATIEAWVRPDEFAPMQKISGIVTVNYEYNDDDDTDTRGMGMTWANREDDEGIPLVRWHVGAHGGKDRFVEGRMPRGQWTHVAGTWFEGEVRLYINGELADSIIRSSNDNLDWRENLYGVWIGQGYCRSCDSKRKRFNGTIDEVRIWSEERTQAQIQALRYTPLADLSQYPELQGYWRLDAPHDGEPDYFTHNLVAIERGRPDLDTIVAVVDVEDNPPTPLPVCFCANPDGLCTATDLYLEFPYEAVLTAYGDTCLQGDNCTFVHGMLIDPNGGTYVARGFGTSGA